MNYLNKIGRFLISIYKQNNVPKYYADDDLTNIMKICQVMIFRHYTVYNKHEVIKIGNYTREKQQILSQLL